MLASKNVIISELFFETSPKVKNFRALGKSALAFCKIVEAKITSATFAYN